MFLCVLLTPVRIAIAFAVAVAVGVVVAVVMAAADSALWILYLKQLNVSGFSLT